MEVVEESDTVEIVRKRNADGMYKIWRVSALQLGGHALVEFTQSKGNIWV